MAGENLWALTYEDFNPVAEFGAIVELTFTVDSRVVNAPIEQGSFTSYNKTEIPDAIGLRAMLKGDADEQEETLVRLRQLKSSTELLRLLTPFEGFENLNLTTLKWERTSELGSTRTFVDLAFQEIKQAVVRTERMKKPTQCKNATSVSNAKTGRVATNPISSKDMESINKRYPKEYVIEDDK